MPIHAHNYHPEPLESPPCPDEFEYERNCRNGIMEEIFGAIDTIDSCLGELDESGFSNILHSLAELRDYLRRDYERGYGG